MAKKYSNADSACSFIDIPARSPFAEIEPAHPVGEPASGGSRVIGHHLKMRRRCFVTARGASVNS